jgi:hypothetical protein
VRLVWHSAGLIENGGFHYLFEGDFRGDPGFVYTAAAYHRIGAFRAYEAFQDAIRQFPGGLLPTEVSQRLRVYESIPAERWDEIAGRYYDATKDTEGCLARFIREHRDDYARVLETKGAEPVTAPNGGPAMPVGNSGVQQGPPSVS